MRQGRTGFVPSVPGAHRQKTALLSFTMSRETKLDLEQFSKFLSSNETWQSVDDKKLTKSFTFPDFATALSFVVKLGALA